MTQLQLVALIDGGLKASKMAAGTEPKPKPAPKPKAKPKAKRKTKRKRK